MSIETLLAGVRVLPVIVIEDVEHAVPLANALLEGGVRVIEVTLRTSNALRAMESIATALPEVTIGAGTVTVAKDVSRVLNAGARFAVSPGLTPTLASTAKTRGLPLLPGVMTPGEVMRARDTGFRVMKLFPAAQAGGIGMLRALAGPFPELRFCPTGGVDAKNFRDYLALANVTCVGGSWLVPAPAVVAQDWGRIRRLAKEATAA